MSFAYMRRLAPVFVLPTAVLFVVSCGDGLTSPKDASGPSAAFGIWVPGPGDTCTVAIHDKYSVVGPDGKLYPTWHPPVDPATGCNFGHEHGRDPRGSNLYDDIGDIPFGYANEILDTWDPNGMRHEDHVGHKIEWENNVPFRIEDGLSNHLINITCDVLTKLHQGTHSKDAFTNNLHELVYHIKCTDGTELHLTIMAAIGTPGEVVTTCDQTIPVGPATPANSPNGGGRRIIPDRACVDQFILQPPGTNSDFNAIRESWQVSGFVQRDDGEVIASVDPYFQVFFPSRFYDPSAPNFTGRLIDVCYQTEGNGDVAQGGACAQSTNNGQLQGLAFDDPRVMFNGSRRFVDINRTRIDNLHGSKIWFTDPFGRHGSTTPFPGAIRQFVAAVNNDYGFDVSGPSMGSQRNYGGHGVHAPN